MTRYCCVFIGTHNLIIATGTRFSVGIAIETKVIGNIKMEKPTKRKKRKRHQTQHIEFTKKKKLKNRKEEKKSKIK